MDKITPIPIGIEFYKEMIGEEYYYIDKTLFIRPRCFGKTLAQTMFKTFFEKEILPDGTVADNSIYFHGIYFCKKASL